MLELLTGIAGVGKTTHCLQAYRTALRESSRSGRIGDVLWITPTHRSAQAILQQLLTGDLKCCWAPGVMTFEQFAERVLRGAGQAASLVNSAERRMLVKAVIEAAGNDKELLHFRKVSETQGFTSQVGKFIAELKRDETWPEAWLKAIEKRPGQGAKDRELGQLYERYQKYLTDWDKYDPEGRFWLARTQLEEGNWQAFPELSLVVVDGFTDFTRTQQEMLILLSRHAGLLLLTLPDERGDRRNDLFARSRQTAQTLQRLAKSQQVECLEKYISSSAAQQQGRTEPAGLRIVRENLFCSPRKIAPAESAEGVRLLAGLGPRAEVREVARRVKQLLLAGIPARSIGVTVRHIDQYAAMIEFIWRDAGVPFVIDQSAPVTSLPLARVISALYGVIREDWSFASLKKLLRHTPLQLPDQQEFEGAGRDVLRSLRLLNLRGGRRDILDSLNSQVLRNGSEIPGENEDDGEPSATEAEEQQQTHQVCFQMALQTLQLVDQWLRPLSRAGSFSEQTQQLLATARELFFQQNDTAVNSQLATPGLNLPTSGMTRSWEEQWDLLAGLLRDGAAFQDRLRAGGKQKVHWRDYAEWVEEQFRYQSLPARRAETDEVQILAASDARHLQREYLFVMGMQEGSFPGRGDHQPFYSEQERVQWNQLGIPLTVRSSHFQEEMQLFYQLVTQAQTELTLSWSRVNTKGAPQYPCSFFQNLQSLFNQKVLQEEQVGQLSPLPEGRDLLTASEIRLQAVQEMSAGDSALLSWWGSRPEQQQSFWALLAAAKMNAARFEQQGFTVYEGLLQSAANRELLQKRFHSEYTFSASRLEAYATCPFRYYLEAVLGLESLPSPRLATDHIRRGNLLHDLLEELHHQDSQDLLAGTDSRTASKLTEKFLELLAIRFEKQFSKTELQKTLDQIERELLTEWSELYTRQTGDYLDNVTTQWETSPQPRYREISFGRKSAKQAEHAGEMQEAALPPVRFGEDAEQVFVEGRIDRIDVGQVEGQEVFTIIDYKTGKPQDVKEANVSRGTQLQLALYAVAVVRLNLLGTQAIPWQVGYWGLREQGFSPQFVNRRKKTLEPLTSDFLSHWESILDRLIPRLVAAMRQGEFPVHNDDEQCTSRCAYRTVCRVGQVRSVAETLNKTWNILPAEE